MMEIGGPCPYCSTPTHKLHSFYICSHCMGAGAHPDQDEMYHFIHQQCGFDVKQTMQVIQDMVDTDREYLRRVMIHRENMAEIAALLGGA